MSLDATLALEDGTWFRGRAAGAAGETAGEVVFNTSMTGYQEVFTDPSYSGQIVTMTCPEIGNYGVTAEDVESRGDAGGRLRRFAASRRSRATGAPREVSRDYLTRNNIVAISDIDTRSLTRRLRSSGVMRGIIATGRRDPAELVAQANEIPADGRSGLGSRSHVLGAVRLTREPRTSSRCRESPRAPAARRGRLRFRHEVEHPSSARRAWLRRAGVPGVDTGGRPARRRSPTACF